MPALSGRLKAAYVPRSASGTVVSVIEKSRTWSSYTDSSSGRWRAGFGSCDHDDGMSAGSARSTNRERSEFVDSPTL